MNSRPNGIDGKVVDLLLIGCDNSTIARELGMKQRTVKARLSRMFQRFGISDRSSTKRVQLAMHFRQYRAIPENIKFTQRERIVAELVRGGLNNREIAERIGTTQDVVKNYVRQILDKTGMGNRLELALWLSD